MPSIKFPININLESTDGTVDRAKIVNGYVEMASQNEVKVYSRPALSTYVAPFSTFGDGAGIFFPSVSGTAAAQTLYAAGKTSNSQMSIGSVNPSDRYVLVAAANESDTFGYDSTAGTVSGSISRTTINGNTIYSLNNSFGTSAPGLQVIVVGAVAQNHFTSIEIAGLTRLTTNAAYSTGANTIWRWSDAFPIPGPGGVYPIKINLSGSGTNTFASAGTFNPPSGGLVSFAANPSNSTVFVKTEVAAYTWNGSSLTLVSDAQYPAVTVRGAVYLNGRLYVMEPDGTIWNSAEDDFTSWAGTDFITAEFEADDGVCLAKHGEYVVALGQFTTEAFYDAGNATGSPLSPVGSAVMLVGCAHANSVAQIENALVWVAQQKGQGSTFHKGRFVVTMKGYGNYERISTPDVERVLDKDAFTEVYADILTVSGHVFYVLTLVDSDITLAYDFRSQLWYDWTLLTAQSAQAVTSISAASQLATAILASHGYNDGDQVVVTGGTGTFTAVNGTHNVNVVNSGTFTYPIGSSFSGTCTTGTSQGWTSGALDIASSCYFDNEQLVQLRSSGVVYSLEGTGVSDSGAPIDFHIRTRNWDGGTNREKFQGSLDVVGDKVSSTALVRYSDDDFQTYTKYKRVDLSLRRPRAKRGGSFSRRAVELRHTLSAKVGISALEADIEMGEQ